MAITYQDDFTGAASTPVVGKTPDVGTNVWTLGAYNTIILDGIGNAYQPYGGGTEVIITGDVAGHEHHEVIEYGGILGVGGRIGLIARKSGTGAPGDSGFYGYVGWVTGAGFVELKRYNGAGTVTDDVGGFPGGGFTQIPGITTGSTVVDLKLVTQNAGSDVVLEIWYRLDGGSWTRLNDAAYTDVAPGTTFTDAGYDGLYLTPDETQLTRVSQFVSNTLSGGGDATPPTVTSFTINTPDVTGTTIININAFTASDNVGVTGYLITESATPPAAGAGGWAASAQTTYDLGSYRSATLYPWAKDAADNVSAVYGTPINVSAAAGNAVPVVTGITVTDASLIDAHVFEITVTATDDVGVTGYSLSTNGTAPPTAQQAGNVFNFDPGSFGDFSVWAWAYDGDGAVSNIAAPVSIRSVDSTASGVVLMGNPFNGGFVA